MKKVAFYRYLGLNGILDTPILLEDVPYTKLYRLIADQGKYLTNGAKKVKTIDVYEYDLEDWKEVKGQI